MLSLLLMVTTAAGDGWPQFLGPTRDGVYAGEALADSWPADGPPLLWKKEIGAGFSGPAVADGRLVLFHRRGDEELVQCLDAATGAEIWTHSHPTAYRDSFGFDKGPRATPAIAAGRVYTFGAEGVLSAVAFKTGARIWSVDTAAKFSVPKGFFGAACSPLIESDRVLMNLGGKDGAGLVAFDRETGAVAWKTGGDQASYSSPVAATIGGRRLVLFLTFVSLTGVDPATGEVRFTFPVPVRNPSSVKAAAPLVIGDQVFISASYDVGAFLLRIKDKEVQTVWESDEALSNHYATSVFFQDHLYGFHGRQEYAPSLRCVELKSGKVGWSEERFGGGTLMLAGTRLLILTDKGELILAPADPERFRPLARAKVVGGEVRAYPALAAGRFYARNENTLVCLDLRKRG